jgi:hypothetical protein
MVIVTFLKSDHLCGWKFQILVWEVKFLLVVFSCSLGNPGNSNNNKNFKRKENQLLKEIWK